MKGFTLLELAVVFFIIAIIAGVFLATFTTFRESGDLQAAHTNIVGLLQDARAKSISSNGNVTHGVHFESLRAVLFKGTNYNALDTSNQTYVLPRSIQIGSVNLTSGAMETVFSQLGGTTTASGTITLQSKNNASKTKTITISSTGLAQ